MPSSPQKPSRGEQTRGLHGEGKAAEPNLLGGPAVVLQPRQPLRCSLPHGGWANPQPLQTTPDEQRATCNGITGGHSPARCLLLHTHVSPDRVQRACGVSVGPLQPQPGCHNEGLKETQCAQFPTLPGTGDSVPLEDPGSAPCAPKLRASQQQPKTFPWVRRNQRAQGARCNDQVTLQPWGGEIPSLKS